MYQYIVYKQQRIRRACAESSEPLLLVNTISTKVSCAGPYDEIMVISLKK